MQWKRRGGELNDRFGSAEHAERRVFPQVIAIIATFGFLISERPGRHCAGPRRRERVRHAAHRERTVLVLRHAHDFVRSFSSSSDCHRLEAELQPLVALEGVLDL
ncbi:unnamed protein product [Heligmosomoides polygyrus]|uniref:DUF1534 domain-containing protein n=1 Tax=Heligmosomoides polygyrus TaxID=6339 RepID=A0A183FPJ9_HELPZ|nr:unnamed protein product [Heligmosomoides polygyrus]